MSPAPALRDVTTANIGDVAAPGLIGPVLAIVDKEFG
jgi:hypothetical protein